jgi:hypothetical protein
MTILAIIYGIVYFGALAVVLFCYLGMLSTSRGRIF